MRGEVVLQETMMTHARRMFSFAAVLLAGILVTGASAFPDGIWDVAKQPAVGCNCHDWGPDNLPASTSPTVVKLFVDGTPLEAFGGFTPGGTHELTVWVVGPVVPFAGFNLQASAGELAEVDSAVKTILQTECERMERVVFCSDCEVAKNDDCPVWDPSSPDCKECETQNKGTDACRPCDDETIVDIQATHTAASAVPMFTVNWDAPSDDTEAVTFWLAGNSVEGTGGTQFDVWNFSDPYPIVIPAAE